MTRRDVLEIGIKITALIFAAAWVFALLGTIIPITEMLEHSGGYWKALVILPLYLLVGFTLLIFLKCGGWIAKKLLSGEDPMFLADLAGSEPSILLLAIKCAGAPLLFLAVISLFYRVIRDLLVWEEWHRSFLGGYGTGVFVVSYVGLLLRLALAAYLLLGGAYLVRLAHGRKKVSQGEAESGETPRGAGSVPQMGTHAWEEPVFVLAVRIVAVVFLVTYCSWLVNVLVFQWVPALRPRGQEEADWTSLFKGLVTLGFCVYLISGGKHLVDIVFRKRPSAADAEGT